MNESPQAAHIRWADLEGDTPLPLVSRRRIVGEQAMLSRFELSKGCQVPTHQHANEQFACVLSGKLRFLVGDPADGDTREVIVSGGEVLHLPGMVPHSAEAIEDAVVIDVFAPPSETTGVDR